MSEGSAGDVGEDLLDDGVVAVLRFGLAVFILSFRVSQGGDLRRPVVDSDRRDARGLIAGVSASWIVT